MKERVLIVGSGGREHALGWKISKSADKPQLFFTPGNAGTAQIGTNLDIESSDVDRIVSAAKDRNAFIVVGPEAPLEKGIVNAANEAELGVFGPTREAARLETSKSWAIDFMKRHNIAHPDSVVFKNVSDAFSFLKSPKWKEIVIKADGLAAGKGVFLPDSKRDEVEAIERIMVNKEFGDSRVIIQERLKGKEVSLICITDGNTIVPLIPAQDYKRLKEGDKGINTGGMGGFAPTPILTGEILDKAFKTILRPTVDGMKEEGYPFQGALYAGLMLTKKGIVVLEFNVRFGDPETQLQMLLLKSDPLPALKSTTKRTLSGDQLIFQNGVTVGRVLAGENYPLSSDKGSVIYGLDKIKDPDIEVFHSGTVFDAGEIKTNGGRIVTVVAKAPTFPEAIQKLDNSIGEQGIHFKGMQARNDIARGI